MVDLPSKILMTLRDQAGVIARQQALEGGLTKSDIDRLVRRREWVRLAPQP